MMCRRKLGWMLVAGTASAVGAIAQDSAFWLIGNPPGTNMGWVTGLTKDGSSAAGLAGGLAVGPGYTWTQSGGRNDFGLQPGMPLVSFAYGISDNGVVAGVTSPGSFNDSRAYRWTGSGPLEDLGVLPNQTRSFGSGISGDGNVVVGYAESGPQPGVFGEAFRWTPSGGMQGLGYLKPGDTNSKAYGVSRDGKTVVGNSFSFSSAGAFVWRESAGMTGLPALPSAPLAGTDAHAVNADGSIVVGFAVTDVGAIHAVRWIDGEPEDIDDGFSVVSRALAVSDDGGVVGGSYSSSLAFLWTEKTGMLDAKDYLALYGVAVPPDYTLEYIYAVSGDGLTFGGQARNLTTGIREGFVATVPGPSSITMLAASMLYLSGRRRRVDQ